MTAPSWCFQGKSVANKFRLDANLWVRVDHCLRHRLPLHGAHESCPASLVKATQICKGVTTQTDHLALLLSFSGPTAPSTRLSEARSYANLAAANAYWGLLPSAQSSLPSPAAASAPPPPSHPPRILLEERALDSYQNILHSLTTFWRSTAHTHWPWRLTIVSHAFKRRRLAHVHCAALGFPLGRVSFIGINPPGLPEVLASEERAVEAWVQDPEGRGPGLRGKREGRNCGGVSQRVFLDEAERAKSGVETVVGEDEDGDEYLVPGGWRPWAEGV